MKNVTCENGKIRIGLYNNNGTFPDPHSKDILAVRVVKPHTNVTTTIFQGVTPGEYAVAIYHDINQNGKLDIDLFGRPAEPFGFSRNPVFQMRIPKFSEANFITCTNHDQSLEIQLKSLKKKN